MKPKLVLIHGWNFINYSKYGCVDAWHHRQGFIDELGKHFEIIKFNLPGFCGEPDPTHPWSIEDYADFVQEKIKNENDFTMLGYSFGAPVALTWKKKYRSSAKLILVSPAIKRKYKTSFSLPFGLKVPEWLRFLYLLFRGNTYYTFATKVMRETYRRIVPIDTTETLLSLPPGDVTLIFGSGDTMTPYAELESVLPEAFKKRTHIIYGGGHDVANTHTKELGKLIDEAVKVAK